jgi:hypothetical protein
LEKFSLGLYLWGHSEVFTRMKKNQEIANTILLEILNGTRPLTEDGIRALVQEDPAIAVLLILEQARRLRDILGSKQRKAASTPSGMIPPHEKPNTQKDKKEKKQGTASQVTKGLAAKIRMRLHKQWSRKSALLLSCGKCAKAIKVKRGHGCNLS